MQSAADHFPKKSLSSAVSPVESTASDESSMPSHDRERFVERALRDYESPLIAYAQSILHNREQARDVVQETFIRLCRQPPATVETKLKSWLFTVCRNRALDVLRKDQRIQPLSDLQWQAIAANSPQPDEIATQDERRDQLLKQLERLSANQRDVILLKFQHGLSYQEIERITGLTSGNIGFLIHSGIQRLRRNLPSDLK